MLTCVFESVALLSKENRMLVVTPTCDQAAFKNRYLMCVEVDRYHLNILVLSQLKLLVFLELELKNT